MNIVKSSTRLSPMLFTFSNSNINDDNIAGNYDEKRWNYLFHPMAASINRVSIILKA